MAERICLGTKFVNLHRIGNEMVRRIAPNFGRRLFLGHLIGVELHETPSIAPCAEHVLSHEWLFAGKFPIGLREATTVIMLRMSA
jgi:hypothetical protein